PPSRRRSGGGPRYRNDHRPAGRLPHAAQRPPPPKRRRIARGLMSTHTTVGMRTAVAAVLGVMVLTGCSAPCWHASDIPLEVITLGTYGLACGARENARDAERRQVADVAVRVRQGSDPAAQRYTG